MKYSKLGAGSSPLYSLNSKILVIDNAGEGGRDICISDDEPNIGVSESPESGASTEEVGVGLAEYKSPAGFRFSLEIDDDFCMTTSRFCRQGDSGVRNLGGVGEYRSSTVSKFITSAEWLRILSSAMLVLRGATREDCASFIGV